MYLIVNERDLQAPFSTGLSHYFLERFFGDKYFVTKGERYEGRVIKDCYKIDLLIPDNEETREVIKEFIAECVFEVTLVSKVGVETWCK